jgi:rhodanese-related sulfurtransferase
VSHPDVPIITRDELRERLASAAPPALFEVLPPGYWRKHHLPGAINAPPGEAPRVIAEHVFDPNAEIVVYCWDDT